MYVCMYAVVVAAAAAVIIVIVIVLCYWEVRCGVWGVRGTVGCFIRTDNGVWGKRKKKRKKGRN